jgi:ketosteroid isomerase-like protein
LFDSRHKYGRDVRQDGRMAEDDGLAGLIGDTAEAASAFIRGDIGRYLELIEHTGDYTLMAPFGGEPVRGFEDSAEFREEMSRYFQDGEATLDVVQTYASGDLAVLVAVERQHGRVGGLPHQDWSLRITLVFRREDGRWRLAHRHADPLVHRITLDQLATIARGPA